MQQTTELTQQNAGTNSLATSTGVTFAYSNEPLTSTAANSNLTNTNLCICPCEYETLQEYWRNETVQRLHWERLPFKLEELKGFLE
ncbi:hypothetical protein FSP39_019699 [Pinctada imbricata]|uniref:Uncharacterized protein n=1 Tax=Pinctada imbricata TaxID=66713 RepID=A0AA88YLF2_PINIB|nr:hypothetical protein FSP39_019699 [Pinctada imbricata]